MKRDLTPGAAVSNAFQRVKCDLRGRIPESWACIDRGINTAPGLFNRKQMEQAAALDWADEGVQQEVNSRTEVYTVRPKVWKAARMEPMGGCLCIGCLEKRLGRTLTPMDFLRDDPFNMLPGTQRLLNRRDGAAEDTVGNAPTRPAHQHRSRNLR